MNIRPATWSTVALFFSLIACISCDVSSLQIVVQFDGSLRPPNDFGFPTSTLGKMAACACTISRSTTDSNEPCLLAMGGKGLNATASTTSGEVEYEGLLYSLKSLRTFLEAQDHSDVESISCITILGDCKTIIDQMNGKSNSRKLEQFYSKALEEVEALSHGQLMHLPLGKLQFQHIPRTKNVICDKISASIILHHQTKVFDDMCSELLTSEDSRCLTDSLKNWFQFQKSLIPLSRRPPLYRYIAESNIKKKDYLGLLEIGSRYEMDVRVLERSGLKIAGAQRPFDDTSTCSTPSFIASKAEAISYQFFSLYELGCNREAVRLQAKNRFLLNGCMSTMVDIENQIKGVENVPKRATIISLKREMDNVNRIHSHNQKCWPVPVQQWYDSLLRSQAWDELRELLLMPNQLRT